MFVLGKKLGQDNSSSVALFFPGNRNLWYSRKIGKPPPPLRAPTQKQSGIPLGGKPTKTSELRASYIASKEYIPLSPGGDTSIKAYRGPVDFNTSFTRMRKYSGLEGDWNHATSVPHKGVEFIGIKGIKGDRLNSSNSNSFSRKSLLKRTMRGHKPRPGRTGPSRKQTSSGRKYREVKILKNSGSSEYSAKPIYGDSKHRSVRFDSANSDLVSNLMSLKGDSEFIKKATVSPLSKAIEIATKHNLYQPAAAETLENAEGGSPLKSHRSSTARSRNTTNSSDSELVVTEFREVMDRPVTLSMSQTFKEFASSNEDENEKDEVSKEAEVSEDILAKGDF